MSYDSAIRINDMLMFSVVEPLNLFWKVFTQTLIPRSYEKSRDANHKTLPYSRGKIFGSVFLKIFPGCLYFPKT